MKNVSRKIQHKGELVTKSFAEYGSIVHLFLQYIPKFNSADYSYLKRMVQYDFSVKVPSFDIIDEAFSEAMSILKKKSLKFLWEDQHNFRELNLAGVLDPEQFPDVGKYIDQAYFYGRLDFLSLTDEKALIIDFKTNSRVPTSEQSMEPSHLVQMAIYIGLMHNAFPDREVTSAILWTKTATLMRVSNKMAFKALREHFNKSSS